MVKECSVAQRHLASENGHACRKKLICAGVADVSELRTQESRKSVGDFSPALFWMLGHQHHGLQSVQLVAEHLALLGKGNLLLHRCPDPKELAHFSEGAAEARGLGHCAGSLVYLSGSGVSEKDLGDCEGH